MNHSGDANKMVGDTPRTDAAYGYHELIKESQRIEHELNAANDHILRLKQAGDEIEMILLQYARRIELPKTAAAEQSELSCRLCIKWRETKDAKP
jgi:hypothetical protein